MAGEDEVVTFDLDTDDGPGVWRVGLRRVTPDEWHALVAAHALTGVRTQEELAAAEDDHATDLVAQSAVWEDDGPDTERTPLTPAVVAGWPDVVTSDVWAGLVQAVFRLSGPSGWAWATQRLQRSPLLALEMAVCREYRIAHSVFLAWTDDDRALAIADLVEHRTACPGCGVPDRVRLDVDAAELNVAGCLWCGVLAQARREATEEQHPSIVLRRGF